MSEEWSTVDVKEDSDESSKVEFEVEEQEEEQELKAAPVVEQVENNEEEEQPEELEGIKTKGAEKRIKQLIRQRKERDEELQQLRSEINNLRSAVQERDTQLSSSLKNSIDSTESQLESNIEAAKQLYKQAVESGDTDGMLTAQESMSKAYAEKNRVEQQKAAWEEYNRALESNGQQAAQVAQQQQQTQEYDPKAVEWATKNSWFGQDQIMTAAALTIDQELKGEGYDPSDDDFYEEVDNRLRQRYPHKFQDANSEPETPRLQNTATSSAQVVAGASRTPKTSQSNNKVKLTQEDVRLANKWGIPLEKYAAEKLKVEQADGEYTSVYS
jgi:hypothetical protein